MTSLFSRKNRAEFGRYLVAGGSAFLVDLVLLTLLVEVGGVNYLLANIVGCCAGFATAYTLSIRWVFRYRKYSDLRPEFVIFVLIGLVGIGHNELTMYLVVAGFGLSYVLAKVLATGVTFLFNFVLRKLLLFRAAPD